MWTRIVVVLTLLTLIGCGSSAAPEPEKKVSKKKEKKPPTERVPVDIKPVEVAADEFPNPAAALTALEAALKLPDGDEQNRAVLRCEKWLVMQKEKAASEVAAIVTDQGQPLPMRLTACRILGQLGPTGSDALLKTAAQGDVVLLRRKAIEQLSRVKPPEPKVIEGLIALLDDKDVAIKSQTINGLMQIGPPAKAAAEKLNTLRKTSSEEQIRVSAGDALKKVNPRSTFVD